MTMNLKPLALFLTLGTLPLARAGAAPHADMISLEPGVVLTVPGGWQIPWYRRGRTSHVVGLAKSGEAINGCLYTAGELHISELDTRRPRHFAERWASTWGLPLYLWGQSGESRITEADYSSGGLTRIVVTAEASGGEAEFLAYSRLRDSGHDARLAVESLLASARGANHRPLFPGVPYGSPQLLTVSDGGSPAKVDWVREGPFDIKIPAGWYPAELCQVDAPSLVLPENDLWILNFTAPEKSLSVNWFTPADGANFRRFATQRIASKPIPLKGEAIRYLALDKSKKLEAETYQASNGAFGTFYWYNSPTLVIIAHSGDGTADPIAVTDAAAVTVARQLAGIRIPDRDVVQSGSGFHP